MDEPLVFLNGRFLPRSQATLDIEDRGVMFADGVYEVVHFYAGRPFAMAAHQARLQRSLQAIALTPPAEACRLAPISAELVQRNRTPDAGVYWQITRGPAPRQHAFPARPRPTLLVMTQPVGPLDFAAPVSALRCITTEDVRWQHCCYKTLMLLANVLAKEKAHQAGCEEAILLRQGRVTEGSSTNVLALVQGTLRTHPADQWILEGVTRGVVLDLARRRGLRVVEQALTLDDLHAAEEVFLTGSTTELAAVTAIDGRPVADGRPGPVTTALYQAFIDCVAAECGITPASAPGTSAAPAPWA